jgi:kynurenine formamidase
LTSLMSRAEFDDLYAEVATWKPDSPHADAGTLRHLTPRRVIDAARLVRDGVSVSLGRTLDVAPRLDNPEPAEHRMTMLPRGGGERVRFAKDYIGVDYHNDTHSHFDALSHVSFRGRIYGGRSNETVTREGATVGAVNLVKDGLVGRGVLVDVPRARGVRWLEPGDQVTTEDIARALRDEGVAMGAGDVLLVRTGHARRQAELPPWDTAHAKAGLHPAVARLLARHRVAALGSDGNSDAAPSGVEGIGFPIHVLALHAMGLYLLDYLQFEDLATECEHRGRWEFLCVVAPLRIPGGTGSPVNPVAIF